MSYPVFLPAVVLDVDSKISVTEGATPLTLTMVDPATGAALTSTPKTFFLRGDNATDDLLRSLRETLATHTGANTYTVTITRNMDGAALPSTVTITRVGANNFSIDWAASLTTVDSRLFGFRKITTTSGTSATSDMSPTGQWIANDIVEELEPEDEIEAFVQRARSGVVVGGLRGGPYDVRRMSFRFQTYERSLTAGVPTISSVLDTGRAFQGVWASLATGKRFELHLPDISAGTTLGALSSSTRQIPVNVSGKTSWHLAEDSLASFSPERLSSAVALYSWRLRLLGSMA